MRKNVRPRNINGVQPYFSAIRQNRVALRRSPGDWGLPQQAVSAGEIRR